MPSSVMRTTANVCCSLTADLQLKQFVLNVPGTDVMLNIDEMIRLERTLSQFLLQNDNDDGEP